MFEFVRTHTRLLQFLLVLLIFPSFVFFGVQGYSQFAEGAKSVVASVDGQSISQPEWDAAHQRQVENARRQNPKLEAKALDTPTARQQTLDVLVRDRVLRAAVRDLHLSVTDERLRALFVNDPQFAAMRNPDGTVNKEMLALQGMSSEGFAAQLRQDLASQQVLRGLLASGVAGPVVAGAALEPLLQRREVAYLRFDAKDYLAKVKPSQADLEAFHKSHEAGFKAPEHASIEYVSIDLETLKKGVSVADKDLRDYYEQNASRYTQSEERRARHILIKADKDMPTEARGKARAQAEALLADVRKAPSNFADLARKHSQDEGSAANGGDLDFFGRGAMVKPFEDAVFAMKAGEISSLIESEFGYHIIKLEALRGGDKKPFEAVRASIDDEVRKQQAAKKWAEVAEVFTNTVYEQSDSLQPVMDKLKLEKLSASVQRSPAPDAKGVLASAKLLDAVFGNDAVNKKRNTDAVEIGPNHLTAARVVQHVPARALPLAEVLETVRLRLSAEQAAALARQEGQARLAEAKKDAKVELKEHTTLSRLDPQGLPRSLLDAVLRADANQLPALLGVDLGAAGYVVVRVEKVLPGTQTDEERKQLRGQYAQAFGQAEALAYYEALKARYKVQIKPGVAAAAAASAPTR